MTRRRIGVLAGLAGGFGALAAFASEHPYFPLDLPLSRWLQGLDEALGPALAAVSFMGSVAPSVIIVATAALWLAGCRHRLAAALTGAAAALLSLVAVPLVKAAVARPRPAPELVRVLALEVDGSFPSGHAAFTVLFYGWVIFLMPRLSARRAVVVTVRAVLGVFIGLTALSRIYLGAHWPSDILGGALAGGAALWVTIAIYRRLRGRFDGKESDAGAA